MFTIVYTQLYIDRMIEYTTVMYDQQTWMFFAGIDPFRFGGLLEMKSKLVGIQIHLVSYTYVEDVDIDWTGQIGNHSIQIKAKDSRLENHMGNSSSFHLNCWLNSEPFTQRCSKKTKEPSPRTILLTKNSNIILATKTILRLFISKLLM